MSFKLKYRNLNLLMIDPDLIEEGEDESSYEDFDSPITIEED